MDKAMLAAFSIFVTGAGLLCPRQETRLIRHRLLDALVRVRGRVAAAQSLRRDYAISPCPKVRTTGAQRTMSYHAQQQISGCAGAHDRPR